MTAAAAACGVGSSRLYQARLVYVLFECLVREAFETTDSAVGAYFGVQTGVKCLFRSSLPSAGDSRQARGHEFEGMGR